MVSMSQEAGENYINVLGIGQMLPWERETNYRVVGEGLGEMLDNQEDVECNNVEWMGQMLPQMRDLNWVGVEEMMLPRVEVERFNYNVVGVGQMLPQMRAMIWVGVEEMLLPMTEVDGINYNVVWVGQTLPQTSIGGGGRWDMLTIILGEEAGPQMLWRPGE